MDRHVELLRDFHANPSFQNRDKYAPIEERVRTKAAALLHVTADEIAMTRNTSEGSNLVVRGLDLKAGDEVLITAHNHPSNNFSWKVRARRDGIVIREAEVPVPAKSPEELVAGLESKLTPRTRVIAVTHVTSTAGLRYPVKELGELARRRGLWYHLDGAQSFGALDVDLRSIGCDSYSTSTHKWAMGSLEAGFLYVKADRHRELWPSIVTAGWSDKLAGARKYEVFGQRDNPRLASLDATLDFLGLIGMTRIEARVTELTGVMKDAFAADSRLLLRTNRDPRLSHGVIKVDLRAGGLKEAYDKLYNKRRLAIAMTPSGDSAGLRLSPHIYNTREEILQAIEAVRQIAG
jgi:selenocysteine lyase/cysteine desulfurase